MRGRVSVMRGRVSVMRGRVSVMCGMVLVSVLNLVKHDHVMYVEDEREHDVSGDGIEYPREILFEIRSVHHCVLFITLDKNLLVRTIELKSSIDV